MKTIRVASWMAMATRACFIIVCLKILCKSRASQECFQQTSQQPGAVECIACGATFLNCNLSGVVWWVIENWKWYDLDAGSNQWKPFWGLFNCQTLVQLVLRWLVVEADSKGTGPFQLKRGMPRTACQRGRCSRPHLHRPQRRGRRGRRAVASGLAVDGALRIWEFWKESESEEMVCFSIIASFF